MVGFQWTVPLVRIPCRPRPVGSIVVATAAKHTRAYRTACRATGNRPAGYRVQEGMPARLVLALVAALAVLLVASACGGANDEPAPAPSAPATTTGGGGGGGYYG